MEITTTFTGPECDGPACDDYEHRAGCSLFDDEPVSDATIVNYAQDARDAGAIETERDAEVAYATVESVARADGDPMERDPLDRGGAAWADFDPSTDVLLSDGQIDRDAVNDPGDEIGDPIADRRWAQDRRGPADRRVSGTDRRIAYAVDSIGRGTYGNRGTDGTHRCAEHVSQAPPCDSIGRGTWTDDEEQDAADRVFNGERAIIGVEYTDGSVDYSERLRDPRGQSTVGAAFAIVAVLAVAFAGAMVLRSILEAAAAAALR